MGFRGYRVFSLTVFVFVYREFIVVSVAKGYGVSRGRVIGVLIVNCWFINVVTFSFR